MIVERNFDEVITSGNTETAQASIAVTPEMFKLLSSGIYENKIAAIVRELTCNGSDAQALAGSPNSEMIMHIPNTLEPWWSIRDFGTGLPHEQVMKMYVTYGMSTKGESNDFIGAMGIGSKSPLAYTDSFMVTSFYDGFKRVYNIFMDNGIPNITLMSEEASQEPTGFQVMLQVRADNYFHFKHEAELFLKLFQTPVKVVGASLETECTIDDKGTYTIVENYPRGLYARMGGVVYRLADSFREKIESLRMTNTIVLDFPIGDLSVAASRETLSMDSKTTKAIEDRLTGIDKAFKDNIQKEVDTITKPYDVMKVLTTKYGFRKNWYNKTNMDWINWNGEPIAKVLEDAKDLPFVKSFSPWGREGSTKLGSIGYYQSAGNGDSVKYVLVNPNRRIGNIKFGKAYAKKNEVTLLYIECDTVRAEMKEHFGFDEINVESLYDEYCPKAPKSARTAVKKTSGLFVLRGFYGSLEEVTELPEDAKGYYLEMHRNKVIINKKNGKEAICDWKTFNVLMKYGKFSEVYFVRKSGMKVLKGIEGMKPLTGQFISDAFKGTFNKFARKRMRQYINATNSHVLLNESFSKEVVEALGDTYRVKASYDKIKQKFKGKHRERLDYYEQVSNLVRGVLGYEFPKVKRSGESRAEKCAAIELEAIFEKYPMLRIAHSRTYLFSDYQEDLVCYINSKK